MAELRELLLALERPSQPLDAPVRAFAALLAAPGGASARFLAIHPLCEPLLRCWPEAVGHGARWEQRESVADFLDALALLLRAQTQRDPAAAETLALKVVRDRSASLEKFMTWSDKPIIEFRALELVRALVQVSGTVAREFVRLFNLQSQAFVKMATRRFKKPEPPAAPSGDEDEEEQQEDSNGDTEGKDDQLKKPLQASFQIRDAYVGLVLELAGCTDKSVHRFALKEGGLVASLFKSIDGDSAETLAQIFDKLGKLVLDNSALDFRAKTSIWSGTNVLQLLPLLQSDEENVISATMGMLNKLFFAQDAIFVMENATDAFRAFLVKPTSTSASGSQLSLSFKQALSSKTIKGTLVAIGVNELLRSPAAMAVATKFLTKYPSLIADYLAALSIPLEPRPAYRWFCVASLLQKLLACSIDASVLPCESGDESASWCSPQLLATRLIAPINYKKELSRGIQHANDLVVYSTLGIMEAILHRFDTVATKLKAVSNHVLSDLESELRFLLPSPEALVSLLLKMCGSTSSSEKSTGLIYVRSLSVFRLYVECFPQTISEVKLDFTKLLAWHYLEGNSPSPTSTITSLRSMIVAEMLRFLLAIDSSRLSFLLQRGTTNGGSSGSESKLLLLLLLDVNTSSKAVQQLCDKVITRVLLISGVFGASMNRDKRDTDSHNNEEIGFWLESLHNGGAACARFVEELAQAVAADPFASVAVHLDLMKFKSKGPRMSVSPITMALVSFLNAPKTVASQGWQGAYRSDPVVVLFAVRILLLVLYSAGPDARSLALMVAGGVTKSLEKTTENDPASGEIGDDEAGKKRKRSDQTASSTNKNTEDAYTWLKQYTLMIVGGGKSSMQNQSKKARVSREGFPSSHSWKKAKSISELRSQLASLLSGSFIANWEAIVKNCEELTGSFELCHHYLLANGAEDLMPLLIATCITDGATKSKKTENHPFVQTLPPAISLQYLLLRLSKCDIKDKSLDSVTVEFVQMVQNRSQSGDAFLTTNEAVLMVDQLLFYFSIKLSQNKSHAKVSDSDKSLCELLQILLVHAMISCTDDTETAIRRVLKLDSLLIRLTDGTNANSLAKRLLAARIAISKTLPVVSSDERVPQRELLRSALVPSLAIRTLLFNCPQDVLAGALGHLLQHHEHQFRARRDGSRVVRVLLSQTIKYLSQKISVEDSAQHLAFSINDLWHFIISSVRPEGDSCRLESTQLLGSGLELLQKLGNLDVSGSKAVEALDSTFAPAIIEEAMFLTQKREYKEPQILRMLAGVLSQVRDEGVRSWAEALESCLLIKLEKLKNAHVACVVMRSVYDVLGRIRTEGLRHYVTTWLIPEISNSMLLQPDQDMVFVEAQVATLRHWISSNEVSSYKLHDAANTSVPIFSKLTKKHKEGAGLTRVQLVCLLVLARSWNNANLESLQAKEATEVTTELISLLVRCSACSVSENSRDAFNCCQGVSIIVQLFLAKPGLVNVSRVLKTTLSIFSGAVAEVQSNSDQAVFKCFVELSSILLLMVSYAKKLPAYDFAGHLAAITEHSSFVPSLSDDSSEQASFRLTLIRVLSGLVDYSEVYTATLFAQLLGVYNMTLSRFDRSVRALVMKFERQQLGTVSLAHFGFRFGASASSYATSSTRADLVEDAKWLISGGLEFGRVRASIERFPLDRGIESASDDSLIAWPASNPFDDDFTLISSIDQREDSADVYDPAYLFPMLAHFVAASALAEDPFIQQGLLGLALRATSSSIENVREYAYGILAHIHESLAAESSANGSDAFKAGRQIHLLLDAFRSALDTPLQRAPSVITVFLNDAISILCRPAHAMYPPVNAFFLSRPALDLHDVPMFYALFNSRVSSTTSSAQQYKQERAWLLHSLRRGVRDDQDVQLMTRRHALSLLLSFFSTPAVADEHTQTLVLQVLHSVARSESGRTLLVTKCAALEWVGAQFARVVSPLVTAEASIAVSSSIASVVDLLLSLLCRLIKDTAWEELGAQWKLTASRQASNALVSARIAVTSMNGNQLTRQTWVDHGARIENALASISEASVRVFGLLLPLSVLEVAVDCIFVAANNDKGRYKAHEEALDMKTGLALSTAEGLFDGEDTTQLAQKLVNHSDFDVRLLPRWARLFVTTASLVVESSPVSSWVPGSLRIVVDDLIRTKRILGSANSLFELLPALRAVGQTTSTNLSDNCRPGIAALV